MTDGPSSPTPESRSHPGDSTEWRDAITLSITVLNLLVESGLLTAAQVVGYFEQQASDLAEREDTLSLQIIFGTLAELFCGRDIAAKRQALVVITGGLNTAAPD